MGARASTKNRAGNTSTRAHNGVRTPPTRRDSARRVFHSWFASCLDPHTRHHAQRRSHMTQHTWHQHIHDTIHMRWAHLVGMCVVWHAPHTQSMDLGRKMKPVRVRGTNCGMGGGTRLQDQHLASPHTMWSLVPLLASALPLPVPPFSEEAPEETHSVRAASIATASNKVWTTTAHMEAEARTSSASIASGVCLPRIK